ncbi:hypothetical protein [Actinacidiphila yeochonensis]|uniref:hypothetical protein n=1 Tax=Actinacidiphila yeochonensis TaxID=89050 RepID=UPI000A9FEE9F|nr:hypothetical protein [Actinacidiphila yeochonensis]
MSARLALAPGPGGAAAVEADLAAFLGRLVRWDKAAVVRLRSAVDDPALGVFGQPPFGGVVAVKSLPLAESALRADVDATVSVGQLLEAVSAAVDAREEREFTLPPSVTGPAWAGVLPPRGGWRRLAELDAATVREVAARVVAEFRARTEALVPERRSRAEFDALAEELWQRSLPGGGVGMTLRAVHAAHALGFLPARRSGEAADEPVVVLAAGAWLRLRTGYGSVAMRAASAGRGLLVSPL